MDRKTLFSFYIDPEELAQIRAICAEKSVTVSELLRGLIADYVQSVEDQQIIEVWSKPATDE